MKPDLPPVLVELAALIVRNAGPDIADSDRLSALAQSAMLLNLAASTWDGAAHELVLENREIRRILGEPQTPESDFRISALSIENARLRSALITLHAAIENTNDPRAAAIWQELARSTERRMAPGSPV